jgi:hypothetical protein
MERPAEKKGSHLDDEPGFLNSPVFTPSSLIRVIARRILVPHKPGSGLTTSIGDLRLLSSDLLEPGLAQGSQTRDGSQVHRLNCAGLNDDQGAAIF